MAEEGTGASRFAAHIDVRGRIGHDHRVCRLRDVLDRVGDRWSVLVMAVLRGGPMRYSDVRRRIDGISQRMLTLTLRSLERDGLVVRTVTPSTPPRVDYALTPAGRTLTEAVASLILWADQNREHISQSRRRFDAS
ncbi:winged helix-turn-helix transcriptional regulator [Streptomyces sp. NPDC001514]